MLTIVSRWLLKVSSTWVMLVCLLLMILFMVFVLPAQAADSASTRENGQSPDTTFFFTPEELFRMAEDFGSTGRKEYIQSRWTFDLVFPLVYTAFLTTGISWFIQRLINWPTKWRFTNLLPVFGGVFDLLENTVTTYVMLIYPARSEISLSSASLITPIKWILVSSSFIPYFLFGAAWLIQKFQPTKN